MIQRAFLCGLGALVFWPGIALAQAATDAETLAIFDAVCLGSLPGFEAAGDGFVEAGLARTSDGFWSDDARGLIGRTTAAGDGRQRACLLAHSGADVAALNAVLGGVLGDAMGESQVGEMRGPMPGDPSLYLVDRGDYRVTAVVANVSRGYAMLSVSVDVAEGAEAPWGAGQ